MAVERTGPAFTETQRSHFLEADQAQYRWTTTAPGIAESEDALLAPVTALLDGLCLEMGCGEGNNVQRISRGAPCVGIDRFVRKLQFASQETPQARFAAADAVQLPFRDGAFPNVFIRDLLHHLPRPEAALEEALRVLAPGGRLCLLEPNGRNPLIWLQTHLVPAEVGARDSTFETIGDMLRRRSLDGLQVEALQPLALRRLALHYRMGLPALGRFAPTAALLQGLESALGGLLPRSRWTYIFGTGIKPR